MTKTIYVGRTVYNKWGRPSFQDEEDVLTGVVETGGIGICSGSSIEDLAYALTDEVSSHISEEIDRAEHKSGFYSSLDFDDQERIRLECENGFKPMRVYKITIREVGEMDCDGHFAKK